MYAYLRDQTVRNMNTGLTGREIGQRIVLRSRLRRVWHTQGVDGSVSHNFQGISQRYMT